MASFAEELRQLSIIIDQRFNALERSMEAVTQKVMTLDEQVQRLLSDAVAQPYIPGSGNVLVPKGFVFCIIDEIDSGAIAKASPTKSDPNSGQIDKDTDNQIENIWAPGMVTDEFCLVFHTLKNDLFQFVAIGFGNRVRKGTIIEITNVGIVVTFDDQVSPQPVDLKFFAYAGADPSKAIPDLREGDTVPCISVQGDWYLSFALNGRIDC